MSDTFTKYGFTFGPAEVTRLFSDRSGHFMTVETKRNRLDVHITPSGLIRTGLHKYDPANNTFSTTRPKNTTP